MIATGWSNGQPAETGAGYGIKISKQDRDTHLDTSWTYVTVEFDDGTAPITASLSPGFWKKCPELRSSAIGRWLLRHRLAPWPRDTSEGGLTYRSAGTFYLTRG